jgi:4-hydroxy-3-methylbut-2-enyl diphosphate reductase
LHAVKRSAIKKFEIPAYYRSPVTGRVKEVRRSQDIRKKDFTPTLLDFGPVRFYIARHFGFCYGVENAIDISYRALEENSNRKVYLLSQMIHNQQVNEDLQQRGVEFIMDTDGTQLIPWHKIDRSDIVIIPAFGTTLEIERLLLDKGVEVQQYNTTCPFVEKVWNRAGKLGLENYTVVIHGKPRHEETRATFSHSAQAAPSVVISNIREAEVLGSFITGSRPSSDFFTEFAGRYSTGFDPNKHLQRIGVVNQTTMLASETQAIAEYLRGVMVQNYGELEIKQHFADTRDTLCYATNDNQEATYELLKTGADLAVVVGGYNSSNTSHIVELCETRFKTFFINSEEEIVSSSEIRHFNYHTKKRLSTYNFLPTVQPVSIVLTSGASCPDTLVDKVMLKLVSLFRNTKPLEEVMAAFVG